MIQLVVDLLTVDTIPFIPVVCMRTTWASALYYNHNLFCCSASTMVHLLQLVLRTGNLEGHHRSLAEPAKPSGGWDDKWKGS